MKYPNNGLRKDELYRRFTAPFQVDDHVNGLFYEASAIFFRNLANYLVDFSELKDAIYDRVTLLKWEEECNCNEIIIQILAEKLKIYIELLFFADGQYQLKKYGEENPYKIMLLIKPGHYNIGLFEENPDKQE